MGPKGTDFIRLGARFKESDGAVCRQGKAVGVLQWEKSPWEFNAEGMNLFNTTGVQRDSFSQSLLSTYSYFIQKRYWLFSVMVDL